MKKLFLSFLFCLLFISISFAQNFKFDFVTDTHIGSETADEDLERTVADINMQSDVNFVIIKGDITEMGTDKELALAKEILDKIEITNYIIPGNHDTGSRNSRMDGLLGTNRVREQLQAGVSPGKIVEEWKEAEANFRKKREKYLLY